MRVKGYEMDLFSMLDAEEDALQLSILLHWEINSATLGRRIAESSVLKALPITCRSVR